LSPSRPSRARPHARGARQGAQDEPAFDPTWAPEQAQEHARQAGLGVLGDHHWKVITSCREEAARTGHMPALHTIETLTGFDAGELHALFPGDFEAIFARIAGLTGHLRSPRNRPGDGSKES
jgi:hypothetical protein